MVLTERGVASRVRARRFGARHGKAVEDGHVLAVRGQVWSGLLWLGEAVEASQGRARSGWAWFRMARQSMRGVALLGGAMYGTARLGEVGCGRAVVEWRVLVRLVLASFGEVRLGRATQSRC
jgi:hypothetical protein